MFRRNRRDVETCPGTCCSFCRKPEGAHRKLISNPSDYPRAYICDECVAVCHAILSEDREEYGAKVASALDAVLHPHASELIAAMNAWVARDAQGLDSSNELAELRRVAHASACRRGL
jgi:ClpX C4-type zinc finger protein